MEHSVYPRCTQHATMEANTMQETALLELRGICKFFPGVRALDGVDFTLCKGEIHALMGENGAGKSTLIKVLTGVYSKDEGTISMEGTPVQIRTTQDALKAGISTVYQEITLCPNLTVAENLYIGRTKGAFTNWRKMNAGAKKLLSSLGIPAAPTQQLSSCSIAVQQMVAIARAVDMECKVLILDEPTSSLDEQEAEKLFKLMLDLKSRGVGIIFVTHFLEQVYAVCDRITVLRDGRTVADFEDASQVSEDTLIKHMVGRELSNRYPPRAHKPSEDVFFEVKDWCVHHPEFPEKLVIKHADIQLRRGEVVGLAGLMGAGRTEFAMSVFGKSYGCSITGEVYKGGRKIDVSTVPKAIENGIAYLSEDRKTYGLILTETISKNISMANLKRISKAGVLNLNKEIKETGENAKQFGVKCASIFQNAGNLSGGNQQKVVLAKWMFNLPDVLILDEPTRGIDVGAKYDIYCIINELAASGKCVLVISSELPELLGVCDRIYVMNEGEIKGEKLVQDATQENIMRLLI